MDRFDLHWPRTEASFLTDGRRCRIVWRSPPGRGGGPGGSIDNNDLCKKRLADSLPLAPELLEQLRSRGYEDLAVEIQALSGGNLSERDRVTSWLDELPGDDTWKATGARRGKSWLSLGMQAGAELELRVPASRGRSEWVLKRTGAAPASGSSGKAEFVVASSLKGIFGYLVDRVVGCDDDRAAELVERVLSTCIEIDHPDVKLARERWQSH